MFFRSSRSSWIAVLPTTILTFLFFVLVDTAPIEDKSILAVNWGNTPSTRGTLSILFSCGAALLICVWTGVHLNVSPIETTHKQLEMLSRILERLTWAFVALVAPDIILVVALHQLLVAIEYQRFVNKMCGSDGYSDKKLLGVIPRRNPEWMGLKMAFFTIMGGFSVQVHNVNGTREFALKFPDFDQLGMIDRIHDFPLSEIRDKSKVSGFAKIIACIQTGWVLLQCLGRQVSGMHITLLELNTAVHVLLAIVVYLMWWQKPVDITRPILVLRRGEPESSHNIQIDSIEEILKKTAEILEKVPPSNVSNQDSPTTTKHTTIWSRAISALVFTRRNKAPLSQDEAYRKLILAKTVCDSIKTVPEEVQKRIKYIPTGIKDFLWHETKKDVTSAVMDNKRSTDRGLWIHGKIRRAAYTAAFKIAYRAAFRAAHTEIHGMVTQIGINQDQQNDEVPTNTENSTYDTSSSRLVDPIEQLGFLPTPHIIPNNKGLTEALKKAFKVTRAATFEESFRAAYTAAFTVSIEVGKESSTTSDGPANDTTPPERSSNKTEKISVEPPTKNPTPLPPAKFQNDENLVKPINNTCTNPQKPKEGGQTQVLVATLKAAKAATRAATRQAVRIAALDECLGKKVSGEAVANALKAFLQKRDPDPKNFGTEINKVVEDVKKHVLEEFRARYRWGASRSGLGTDVQKTAGFVHWASIKGTYQAVFKLVSEVSKADINENTKKAVLEVLEELEHMDEATEYHAKRNWKAKLKKSLHIGFSVLTNQIIQVPDLFQRTHHRLGHTVNGKGTEESVGENTPTTGHEAPAKPNTSHCLATGTLKHPHTGLRRYKGDVKVNYFSKSWRSWHRIIILVVSGIVGAFYGAIHSTKWFSNWFATDTEHFLWQISCIVGATSFIPIGLLYIAQSEYVPIKKNKTRRLAVQIFLYSLLTITAFLFMAARLYLIFESFVALRHLPPGAFNTVRWSEYIPHL